MRRIECTVQFQIFAGVLTTTTTALPMKFSVEQDDELVTFTLKEPRLDSTTAPEVKSELLILLQEGIKAIIIDLSNVEFCDSQGLSALLLAHRQMKESEGFVLLVGVNENVRNLLRISQIEYLFEFHDTVEAAVASLEG